MRGLKDGLQVDGVEKVAVIRDRKTGKHLLVLLCGCFVFINSERMFVFAIQALLGSLPLFISTRYQTLGFFWNNTILRLTSDLAPTDAGLHFRENGRTTIGGVGEEMRARKSGNVEL